MQKIIQNLVIAMLLLCAAGLGVLLVFPESLPSALLIPALERPAPLHFSADPGEGFRSYYRVEHPRGQAQLVTRFDEVPLRQRATRGRIIAPIERSESAILAQPQITIYTARWCGYCKKMLRAMDELGLSVENKDIERTPEIAAELLSLSGSRGIPFTLVAGEPIHGYDPLRLKKVVKKKKSEASL